MSIENSSFPDWIENLPLGGGNKVILKFIDENRGVAISREEILKSIGDDLHNDYRQRWGSRLLVIRPKIHQHNLRIYGLFGAKMYVLTERKEKDSRMMLSGRKDLKQIVVDKKVELLIKRGELSVKVKSDSRLRPWLSPQELETLRVLGSKYPQVISGLDIAKGISGKEDLSSLDYAAFYRDTVWVNVSRLREKIKEASDDNWFSPRRYDIPVGYGGYVINVG